MAVSFLMRSTSRPRLLALRSTMNFEERLSWMKRRHGMCYAVSKYEHRGIRRLHDGFLGWRSDLGCCMISPTTREACRLVTDCINRMH